MVGHLLFVGTLAVVQSGATLPTTPYAPGAAPALTFVQNSKSAGSGVAESTTGQGSTGANSAGSRSEDGGSAGGKSAGAGGASDTAASSSADSSTFVGGGFAGRFFKAYKDEFYKKEDPNAPPEPERPRRALPSPWESPPFPNSEYQGYPLLGVPYSTEVYPFMKAVYGADTPFTDAIKASRIKFEGWVNASANYSTARNSNIPFAYWNVPNRLELDQLVFKVERVADTVQTDHWDYGFRSVALYGMDYRYTTAGGYFSEQLLKNNDLYGWDPVEQYFNVYIPGFLGGTDVRVGRWIACPDIETQYAPDNYNGSHSLLFTVDTYTQTGIMVTQKINDQFTVQGVLHAGTDMAPWYKGAIPTGAVGFRYVTESNNDAFYTWYNAINNAQFRHFTQDGQPAGHDNFNYIVSTWEHKFSKTFHTKTEAYYMYQFNAELGGTPSLGPVRYFGGGGGDAPTIPGLSETYGAVNFTNWAVSKNDFFVFRNEFLRDERGMRLGTPGNYSSTCLALSHNFNSLLQIRPEIGYYRCWDAPAFDLGTKHGLVIYGLDVTLRF